MSLSIHTRIQKLRQLPPGRAHQASSNVERVGFPLGYHVLHPFTHAARDAARHYLDLRTVRFGERQARGDGEASKIDREADVRVGFIYDAARRYAVELPGTPEAAAAERVLRRYFPRGLRGVVGAPYEEELIQLDAMVDGLTGDDADAAELLRVDHHVATLRDLTRRYAIALDRQVRVTPQELKSAWQNVHHRVLELAFAIVTHIRNPEHRSLILSAIFEQDDRLAAVYAARQRGQDVGDLDVDAAAERAADLDLLDGEGDGEGFDPLDAAADDVAEADVAEDDAADAGEPRRVPVDSAPPRQPLPRLE